MRAASAAARGTTRKACATIARRTGVRASTICLEKSRPSCRASDSISRPFQAGLTVRMAHRGLLRPGQPLRACSFPQAVHLPHQKIIAEPQHRGAAIAGGRCRALRARPAPIIDYPLVAIMPAAARRKPAVIRSLPKDRGLLVFDKLGLAPNDETRLRQLLKLPHGMIVITGPTGSGKTTTLATSCRS